MMLESGCQRKMKKNLRLVLNNLGTFTQETGIDQIMGSENGKAMIFTIDGKRVDNLKKGLNVICMKNGTMRKVVVR